MRKTLTPEIVEQYRMVQRKIDAQKSAGVSNEDFLRASNVRVVIEHEVEQYLDDVVEMLNGTNEINYTKRRIKTDKDLENLREELRSFGIHAGCVFVADDHGDYGFTGFFMMRRLASVKQLIHFTFSCRIMDMGVEQYVYDMLGQPEIDIVKPVTRGLRTHEKIDWINQGGASSSSGVVSDQNLVLLGGCDLLQLASYCSVNRQEFVSKVKDGVKVRYDDPGFILNERDVIKSSNALRKIPFWTYEDATNFDAAVQSSQLVLVSLWPAARGHYFRTSDHLLLHMNKQTHKQIRKKKPGWLKKHVTELNYDLADRLKLVVDALDRLGAMCSAESRIFLLGVHTFDNLEGELLELRTDFNATCRNYCAENAPKFTFVEVNEIVPRETLIDRAHFTRQGYFMLAKHIMDVATRSEQPTTLHAA
jgi:hypothetical protein